MILPLINPYQNSSAPILTDIQNCQLPAVSWVFTPIQPTDPTHNSNCFINFYQSTVPGQTQPLPPDGPESGDPGD